MLCFLRQEGIGEMKTDIKAVFSLLASLKRLCTQAYCKESVMNVNCNKHKIHLENIVNSG